MNTKRKDKKKTPPKEPTLASSGRALPRGHLSGRMGEWKITMTPPVRRDWEVTIKLDNLTEAEMGRVLLAAPAMMLVLRRKARG